MKENYAKGVGGRGVDAAEEGRPCNKVRLVKA